MPFFKKLKFKINNIGDVKFRDPQDKPEENTTTTLSEPKQDPLKPVTEANDWSQEFQDLQPKWHRALEELHVGFTNIMRFDQDGQPRFFYCLRRLGEKLEKGQTTRELLCLRDDFELFRVTQTVHWDPTGITNVELHFDKADDPKSFGLNPAEIKTLVKEVCDGNTPV